MVSACAPGIIALCPVSHDVMVDYWQTLILSEYFRGGFDISPLLKLYFLAGLLKLCLKSKRGPDFRSSLARRFPINIDQRVLLSKGAGVPGMGSRTKGNVAGTWAEDTMLSAYLWLFRLGQN